jgi:hypothetical protein
MKHTLYIHYRHTFYAYQAKNFRPFKKYAFFLHFADTVICMNRSSYNFTDAFKERLEALSKEIGKTQTAVIIDAVNAYAAGTLPDKKIVDLLNQLLTDNAAIKQSIEDNRALLMAILKELQKG